MKYIIMCGGNYKHWEKPRQLSIVKGEELVARTIRLLKENGIEDINISSNNPIFEKYGVPVLKHNNEYDCKWHSVEKGDWFNCFYPTEEPACYIFGDVYFSDEAIKKIVETKTNDIEFFGSKKPFADNYIKDHEEPFALKVANQEHLHKAIKKTRELDKQNKFWRKPIMWELWTVIKNTPLQTKVDEYPAEYIGISDYTCDIDWEEDVKKLNRMIGGVEMIKVEVIEGFTLERFNEIEDTLERRIPDQKGKLNVGDVFKCEKELADYLLEQNAYGKPFVKVIEIIPEVKEEPKKVESKPVKEIPKKTTKKKTSKK